VPPNRTKVVPITYSVVKCWRTCQLAVLRHRSTFESGWTFLAATRTRAASKARVDVVSEEARLALGRRIRDAREARGLATLVKKNQGYISRIERGQFNLRIDTIASLAVALGMDMAITLTDQSKPARRSLPARHDLAPTPRSAGVDGRSEPATAVPGETNGGTRPRSRPRSAARSG
jgi:transcriptional regulator with XRE-family HTH domain